MTPEERLTELGIELPPAPNVLGLYRPVHVVSDYAYTSGHGPLGSDGKFVCGKLGDDLATEAGNDAARLTGLAMLASLRQTLGSLDRIERLVKTLGLVRCTPEFTEQPAVINGFSELMKEVFGEEAGVAARSAMGAAALPAGWAVEIEATFLIRE